MKIKLIYKRIALFLNTIFFFLEKPGDIRPLIFFRISLSIFCILKFIFLWPYLLDIYGQYGHVQWAITKTGLYDWLPHLGDFLPLAGKLGLSADQLVVLAVSLFMGSCVFLMIGLFTRVVSIFCFILHLILMHTAGGFIYGLDIFTQIALFYCMFMPLGSFFSLDVLLKISKSKPISYAAGLTRKILQLHLCIIYCSTGLEKLMGEQWLNGEAIWRSVSMPGFNQFDMGWLSSYPVISKILSWSVLFFEILYIVLMWIPKVRVVCLIVIIMMHLSIGLMLGMWLFGIIMIILSLAAFGLEALYDLFPRRFSGSMVEIKDKELATGN